MRSRIVHPIYPCTTTWSCPINYPRNSENLIYTIHILWHVLWVNIMRQYAQPQAHIKAPRNPPHIQLVKYMSTFYPVHYGTLSGFDFLSIGPQLICHRETTKYLVYHKLGNSFTLEPTPVTWFCGFAKTWRSGYHTPYVVVLFWFVASFRKLVEWRIMICGQW